MSRTLTLAGVCALLTLVVAVAGCGGGGSKNGKGSTGTTTTTTSTQSTKTGDPAVAVLKKLGLQECSEHQLPATYFVNRQSTVTTSFGGARIFLTAADCSKKGPRTTIIASTWATHEGIAAGKAAIKKKYPKAGVASYRTVVVGVEGGANPQQTANSIIRLLTAGSVTG